MTRLTKRQFLRLVGSAAGVAATYHTMNTLGLLGPDSAQGPRQTCPTAQATAGAW